MLRGTFMLCSTTVCNLLLSLFAFMASSSRATIFSSKLRFVVESAGAATWGVERGLEVEGSGDCRVQTLQWVRRAEPLQDLGQWAIRGGSNGSGVR